MEDYHYHPAIVMLVRDLDFKDAEDQELFCSILEGFIKGPTSFREILMEDVSYEIRVKNFNAELNRVNKILLAN